MDERVETRTDASMEDLTELRPTALPPRPQRKFLGVQVPLVDSVPNFHHWGPKNKRKRERRAIEVLGEEETDEGQFVFVFYEDNSVKRAPARRFISTHRVVWDAYLDSKYKGTLLPFDPSGGPPYVHPDSRMRHQVISNPASVEPSEDEQGGVVVDYEEDEESSEESQEENSDGYEENELEPNVRRSSRVRKSAKIPSPKKRSTRVTRSQVPTTSASEMDEDVQSGSESNDSDIVVLDGPPNEMLRNPPRRAAAKNNEKKTTVPQPPPKPRAPRVPRPVNMAYGDIYTAEDIVKGDPFQAHRPTCGSCGMNPAHELMNAFRKKKSKISWEGIEKMGGWIQCMKCTEAVHWKCLSSIEQTDILKAARLREEASAGGSADDSSEVPKRKMVEAEETTNYVCTHCTRGGVCIGCHHNLDPTVTPKDTSNRTNGAAATDPENAPLVELFFRCATCKRAGHYAHLNSPFVEEDVTDTVDDIAIFYQTQYNWQCDDCSSFESPVDKILAWRPYPANAPILTAEQEEALSIKDHWPREYLVKWEQKSYRRTSWVPHLWLAFTTYPKLRHFILKGTKVRLEHLRSFSDENDTNGEKDAPTSAEELARRRVYEQEDGPTLANRRAEECIPEAWKRAEQVLDVLFWEPSKLIDKGKAQLAQKRKKKAQHVVDSDDSGKENMADAKVVEEQMKKLEALREKTRTTGYQLIPDKATETPAARKRRNGGQAIQEEDIDDVIWCLVKWGELDYSEATWDTPPKRGEPGWDDFEAAFNRYVQSQAVFVAKVSEKELEKRDDRDPTKFAQNKMEIKKSFAKDPKFQLRPFQVEGINWLTFQWWRKHPAILADEMGLGKTVQIITFLAKLVEKKIWPHLVVVPNSTILNWMREFQIWAPNVRAVAYYGEAASRDVIREYEIFHNAAVSGQTKLKLHVLVTTYESFLNKSEWAPVFKAPSRWEVLVIDEGQRLKNNNSLLFKQLNQIRVGHRVLMTGTPLNNNLRELFNLMNFVDQENWQDVEELERQYQQDQLTVALVAELHEKLKQYFLRRTKEILGLPHKHEIIVPVSLSKLQKGLYKSLIEANLSLLDNLLNSNAKGGKGAQKAKASRGNLKNILMQSRKCVQHPYLIESTLEPTTDSFQEMHRQLIDASGKLKFLKIMLARLKARGKRVLLFSQFVIALDIIEDFVVGEGYKFLRLDGDLKSSLRQKDIDKFNAPDSEYFIYLLSTRAGGVGINLATADTVIIFDPDFNPHQDAQAISRAHRFGQKKPVIVFRMMSVTGPETKIMNAGKKKLLLDHVIVQNMDEEEVPEDLEGMLLSGAKALFEDNDENDVVYTEASVDALITNAEEEASKPKAVSEEASAMKFEFAQMWETTTPMEEDGDVDTDFWAKMISAAQEEKERQAALAEEESGRGAKRKARAAVQTYKMDDSPVKKPSQKRRKSDDEDVDYMFQEPEYIPDANGIHTDGSSDIEGGFAHIQELQEEVTQLNISQMTPEDILAAKKEARKKKAREARQRKKIEEQTARLLAAQAAGLSMPEYSSYPASSNGAFASSYGMAGSGAFIEEEDEDQEPVCVFCDQRHGMNQCPMTRTLEGLKVIRVKLMKSTDTTPEEKREALQALDEEITRVSRKEKEQAAKKQAQSMQAGAKTGQPSLNGAPRMSQPTLYATNTSSNPFMFPTQSSYSVTAKASTSQLPVASTSGLGGTYSSAPIMKKRPSDGPNSNEPPAKKANLGVRPAICPLCSLKFHPAVQCPMMNADLATMKRRLQQLLSNKNLEAQPAIDALRSQYSRKKKQAERPPTKFINDSD